MALVRQPASYPVGSTASAETFATPDGTAGSTRRGGQIATRPGVDTLHVSVCGRTVSVPLKDANTLTSLQGALQRELKMHGQDFTVCDSMNTSLVTNGDLLECINNGRLPLSASLAEASIHYIEGRREELSQMQWKLLRDKIEALSQKMNIFDQQLRDFGEALGGQQAQNEQVMYRMQVDVERRFDEAKEHSQGLGAQLAERLEALSQIIHAERNLREAMKEGLMRQMQATRDVLEADRSTRRTESSAANAVVEELRRSLQEESAAREDMFGRQQSEMAHLMERVEKVSREQGDTKQDFDAYVREIVMDSSEEMASNNRSVIQLRAAVQEQQLLDDARMQKLEDRALSLENRIRENANRHTTQINQLWGKTEGISSAIEEVRIKDRGEKIERGRIAKGYLEDREHEPSVAVSRTHAGSCAVPVGSVVSREHEPSVAVSRTHAGSCAVPVGSGVSPVGGSHVSAPFGTRSPPISGVYQRPHTPGTRSSSIAPPAYPVVATVSRFPTQR